MSGWIKISRKINEHWLWEDANKLKWWIDLLLMAAWEEKQVLHQSQIVELKRGQLIASLNTLCQRWGANKKTIMRFLDMVQQEGMIVHQRVHQHISIITICKYDRYQSSDNSEYTNQYTNEYTNQYTNEYTNPLNNNIKNINIRRNKEDKERAAIAVALEKKKKEFYESLIPYVKIYGKEMVRDFYDFWTEENKSGTQFRKQMEKTWNTERRLRMWARNQDKRNSNGNSREPQTTAAQRAQDVASLIARLGEKNKPFEG